MHQWKGGGIWGSLRGHVAYEVREHSKTNSALLEQRYIFRTRILKNLLGNGDLFKLLMQYFFLILLLIILDHFVTKNWPDFSLSWKNESPAAGRIKDILKDATSSFIGAQATLIGLVFPVAIGLVTLLVQKEGSGSTNADIQVYYQEALAYPVGISSIALIIVLAFQIFWPSLCPLYLAQIDDPNLIFKSGLGIFHLSWLILNCVGLWHFLKTSLDFVQPSARASLRKRFVANHTIPNEIAHHLKQGIYLNTPKSILKTDDNDMKVMVGLGSGYNSTPEVSINLKPSILVDLRIWPFSWVLKAWHKRTENIDDENERLHLIFPLEMGRPVQGRTVLCSRNGNVPLNAWEKWLIKRCFVFKRMRR